MHFYLVLLHCLAVHIFPQGIQQFAFASVEDHAPDLAFLQAEGRHAVFQLEVMDMQENYLIPTLQLNGFVLF